MPTYEVRFTALAAAFAKAKLSLAAVEEVARAEIAECMLSGLRDIESLCFHVFKAGGCQFICYPKHGALEIDTCTYEEGPVLDKGPLAGKRIKFPTGDT